MDEASVTTSSQPPRNKQTAEVAPSDPFSRFKPNPETAKKPALSHFFVSNQIEPPNEQLLSFARTETSIPSKM